MISRLIAFINEPKVGSYLLYKKDRIIRLLKELGYEFSKKDLYRFQKDNNLPVENYIGGDIVKILEELYYNRTNINNHKNTYKASRVVFTTNSADIGNINLNNLDLGDTVLAENKLFVVSQRPSGQRFLLHIN